MGGQRWTEEELMVLEDNWELPYKDLCVILPDRSIMSLQKKCNEIGFDKKRKNKVTRCEYCGQSFEHDHSKTRRFCSKSCSARARCEIPIGQEPVGNSRETIEYREWRHTVYQRDSFTCQKCGQVGGDLNAHHIAAYSRYPEGRYVPDNGITFCIDCHTEFHSLYGKLKFVPEDTWEYLEDTLRPNKS